MSTESKDKDNAATPFLLDELVFYEPYQIEDGWAARPLTDASQKVNVNQGKPIVMQFWAPWCGPCKMSTPFLNNASRVYSDVQFLAFSSVESDITENKLHFNYPLVYDTTGTTMVRYKVKFGVRGVPHVLVISKEGQVVYSGHPLDDKFEDALRHVSSQRREQARKVSPETWAYITPMFDAVLPDFTRGKYALHLLDFLDTSNARAVANLKDIMRHFPSDYKHYILVADESMDLRSLFDLPQLGDFDAEFLSTISNLTGTPLQEACYTLAFNDGVITEVDFPSIVQYIVCKTQETSAVNE